MKYVINLPINFFASVRFIATFTSCNGPKYHKARNKSSGNNVIGVFSCVQAPCGVFFKFSDIYNIGIMPGDRCVWGCHVKSAKVNIARYAASEF